MIPSIDELAAWARGYLPHDAEHELVKERAWGLVIRLRSAGTTWYAKAPCDGLACEAGIYEVLAEVAPTHVVRVLATDRAKGWMLLADGGDVLGDDGPPEAWPLALATYSGLQRDLVPQVDRLLSVGVPDHRPAALIARWDEMVEHPGLGHGREGGITEQELTALESARPWLVGWLEELGAAQVPASLQHDDVHQRNVFREGNRLFDWGDAVIAHPFGSLLNALRLVGDLDTVDAVLAISQPDSHVQPMVTAYLEAWADFAEPAQLRREAELAVLLGPIGRVLNWARVIGAGSDFSPPPMAGWLRELLAAVDGVR